MSDSERIRELEYIIAGVMHSVDKWLEGDEFEHNEVTRAGIMREKVLKIIEEKDRRIRQLEKRIRQLEKKFHVGDIVWVIDPMWGLTPCKVTRPNHCSCGEEGGITFEMFFSADDVGVSVFGTKEEAESYMTKGKD